MEQDHRPDPGTAEAAHAADDAGDRAGVGRTRGDGAGPARARARRATSSSTGSGARGCTAPAATAGAMSVGMPGIISRAEWHADENLRLANCPEPPDTSSNVKIAVVHHTGGNNNYGPGDSAAIVRGLYGYATQTLKYCDAHYNFFIDRYGQIFEGRYLSTWEPVRAAHTTGMNTASVGVALIGNFQTSAVPPAAVDALERAPRVEARTGTASTRPGSSTTRRSAAPTAGPPGRPTRCRTSSATVTRGAPTAPVTTCTRCCPRSGRRSRAAHPRRGCGPGRRAHGGGRAGEGRGDEPLRGRSIRPAARPSSVRGRSGRAGTSRATWSCCRRAPAATPSTASAARTRSGRAAPPARRLLPRLRHRTRPRAADGGGGGWVLDGCGGIHEFGGAPALRGGPYFAGNDVGAQAGALRAPVGTCSTPSARSTRVDGAPRVATPYWPGWPIARDVRPNPSGTGGYILDGYGGVTPVGGAPRIAGTPYFGRDQARGLVVLAGGKGYTLREDGLVAAFSGYARRSSQARCHVAGRGGRSRRRGS